MLCLVVLCVCWLLTSYSSTVITNADVGNDDGNFSNSQRVLSLKGKEGISENLKMKTTSQFDENALKELEMNPKKKEQDIIVFANRISKHSRKTREVNSRHLREVRTLVEMLKANAEKLDRLTKNVDLLINGTISKESMDPFFVSAFVMLADIALSTSPRMSKNQEDIVGMLEYFRPNILRQSDTEFFNSKFSSVIDWYINDTSCVDFRNVGFKTNGIHTIMLPKTKQKLKVYCDQETDGGGWLVLQRRQDGSEDFYRSWADYQRGFGNIQAEFWLGNDILHELTTSAQELRIDLMDFDGNQAYAKYSTFAVGSSSDHYTLSVRGYSGSAGDGMSQDNGARFSTEDNGSSCAKSFKGPWWHKTCHRANLNGLYFHKATFDASSVSWYYWKNRYQALKKSEMKIRPKV